MPKIELTHVTKRWDKFYGVDDLNLVIEDNAFVTLLGPSGCGKTTTLRMIAGLETPTSGRITIGDQVVFDSEKGINVPPNKRKVGFLFQNYALWPNMTVYQNIAFGLTNIKEPRRLSKQEIDDIVHRVAKIVHISAFLDRYPAELSGGQQQRVAIARTLAPEPKVLFMDEPLSNLDAKLRLEMRSELQRLHLETGSTFVYVTHDQMEAMTLATKICLMENGVLQQYDAPLTVYGKPNNTFVADFVGNPTINFIDGKAAQNADGSIDLTILGGAKATFTPKAPLTLKEWYTQADAQNEEKQKLLAEKAAQKGYVEKSNKDTVFRYHVAMVDEEEDLGGNETLSDEDLVIGVRPEFLELSENGALEGEIYSAMPTGMETTVKVRVGDYLLTGVVFGGVLYQLGQKVRLDFRGDDVVLFSRRNGRFITQGSLTVQ
ncbi:MAG: ABC transporter ATP-binding protein [Oscillospiraceae bacterium]|nr:ABC transporter ATP-binding protein [Oscillospiraceae bacterium]